MFQIPIVVNAWSDEARAAAIAARQANAQGRAKARDIASMTSEQHVQQASQHIAQANKYAAQGGKKARVKAQSERERAELHKALALQKASKGEHAEGIKGKIKEIGKEGVKHALYSHAVEIAEAGAVGASGWFLGAKRHKGGDDSQAAPAAAE